jgi:hypothetical protein
MLDYCVGHAAQNTVCFIYWKVLDHASYSPDLYCVTSMCLAPLESSKWPWFRLGKNIKACDCAVVPAAVQGIHCGDSL